MDRIRQPFLKHRGVVWLGLALVLLAIAGGKPSSIDDDLPPINAKVVEFARSQLGEKVGNGECTSLAVEAYKVAGAKRFRMKRDADYIWGEPVDSFKEALPGDVVQFRDAVFEGRSRLGAGKTAFWHYEYPHHTAIVAKVLDRGKRITFLHQNIGRADQDEAAKRRVKEDTVRVDSLLPGGQVWIFRPIPLNSAIDPADANPFDPTSKLKSNARAPG